MFCTKCGKEMGLDAVFCPACGASLRTGATSISTIQFIPKKWIGQWMLKKASIEIRGEVKTTKVKKPIELQTEAGETTICCYCNFLGRTGPVTKQIRLEPGKKYEIIYRAPLIIFLKGKITIREYT